ncbi:MAG TPA: histidine phosphatase family protein [Mycobacteriales bacterium]|nr:histidine phosphatase family protein [Mycobacteriales bacterium]
MGAPEVWLVRHGETEWSAAGRHTGTTDLPLTERGREAARAVAPALHDHTFAAVLTSPLRRARETCELAGLAAHAEVVDDLREWDYGEFEGLTTAQIRESRPGWTVWQDGCPGGESVADVGARADRVVARLRAVEGDVAVFAHGHFLRVLGARWCGLAPEAGAVLALDTATLCRLGWEREQAVVRMWNAPAVF